MAEDLLGRSHCCRERRWQRRVACEQGDGKARKMSWHEGSKTGAAAPGRQYVAALRAWQTPAREKRRLALFYTQQYCHAASA